MEFVCRISSEDYRAALRLRRKNLRRIISATLFLDLILWIVWMILAARGDISHASTILQQAIILLFWPGLLLAYLRWSGWYGYKKNRNIQSEFTYRINSQGISYKSSSGGSGEAPWSSVSWWRESKQVFILVYPSGVFLIYPKKCMTDEQCEEFKSMVARALPKK